MSDQGIRPLLDKITAIQNYPLPTTLNKLRQFLVTIQYYNRFIPTAAVSLAPLNEMQRGRV